MNRLQTFGPGIWTVAAPFTALGMDFRNHMTVVALPDGNLWLHSVIPLTPELEQEIRALGNVGHIVVPNTTHNLFTERWRTAWPQAKLYAPPAAKRVTPDLPLSEASLPACQAAWKNDISPLAVTGMAYLNEYVFIHHPSRTLILTDLAFNFGAETAGRTRFALKLYGAYGHLGPSRLIRLLIRDKRAFSTSLERILALDFDRIIMSHGIPLLQDAKQRFSAAFARYC